ncbi:hypothetical protein [Synechococcus sp. J7-Johnson]|nr:hypothetical protein [Synechococcus sp. J7-Johnson]
MTRFKQRSQPRFRVLMPLAAALGLGCAAWPGSAQAETLYKLTTT